MSLFDLFNGSLELLIVLGCVLGSRAVIRRYWTRGSLLPSRPTGLVWLSLLTTVAVFYYLAALQAFGVPLRNGTIEAVLAIGFIGVHAAHLVSLGIRERRRRLTSRSMVFQVPRLRCASIQAGLQRCGGSAAFPSHPSGCAAAEPAHQMA